MVKKHKKIGVLQVLDSLGVGGAEQVVLTLMEGIDRKRFHPVVCTLFSRDTNYPEPLAEEIRALGIRVEQLAMTRWRDQNTIKQFLRLLDEEQISIVHGHMLPADFWGCLLAKIFRRKKTVYTKHCILPLPNSAYRIQHSFLNKILADRIVAISEAVKTHLLTRCSSPPQKVIKIYNPIDVNKFHPHVDGFEVRKELGISEKTIIVGNTSRFEDRKGYNYFLYVAQKITEKYPDVQFLAVGYGPEITNIHKHIHKLKLEGKVILSGPRRDIPQILGSIDIFLFPTLWGEGFGIALAEAMASGKAIVASNVGPIPELIEDGISGLLPTPRPWLVETNSLDTDALVDAVDILIRDVALRNQMGKAACERAKTLFNASIFVRQMENVYAELAKK